MNTADRALARLASANAILAPLRAGSGFGVFPGGDRRRRPVARLSAAQVAALESDGALQREADDRLALTKAGRTRALRAEATPGEAYAAQHRPVFTRQIADGEGAVIRVRGHDPDAALRRLGALQDSAGRPWFSGAELAAATALKQDWERGQIGLVRGSDWEAPPRGSASRGPGNAQEMLTGARCDARQRVEERLASLASPLRRAVEHVCLHERGMEALEQSEGWPARSGKLALKLALAQLARA